MRKEKKEKRNVQKNSLFLLLLIMPLFVFSCVEPLEPEMSKSVENGYGKISVSLEAETVVQNSTPHAVRTVLPPAEFETYTYTFFAADETDGVAYAPDTDGFFTLKVGEYTVKVQAFNGDTLAASGESAPFSVSPNSNTPVKVALHEAAEGEGKFKYAITWPQGAEGEISLQKWPDGESSALYSGDDQPPMELETGYYLLTILVNKNGYYAGVSEIVHIYPAATTEYTKNFEEADLILAQYTVTFDITGATGGTAPAVIRVGAGSTITLPSESGRFSRAGYTFGGWNTEPDGTGTNYNAGSFYTPSGIITLYARWVYTVTFSANGGTGTFVQMVLPGSDLTVPDAGDISHGNYIFDSWNTNSNGTGTRYNAGDSYTPTGAAVTWYAIWKSTVTFDTNGGTGTVPDSQTVFSGSGITLPNGSGLSRDGYAFSGWNTKPDGTGSTYSSSYTPTGTITLYARWVYTVTFDRNDGIGTPPGVQTALPGFTITLPYGAGLSKSGYVFDGWNTEPSGNGTNYAANSSYTVEANATLYAKWVPGYTVVFDHNGGTGTLPPSQTVLPGTVITLPDGSGISIYGNLFDGWNTAANGTGTNYSVGASYTVNANATLYVKWRAAYTVTFSINGGFGTPPSERTLLPGATITLPDSSGFSNSGSRFAGWTTSADGTGVTYSAGTVRPVNSDITYYAKWLANYTVRFNLSGGSGTTPATQSVEQGNTITLSDGSGLSKSDYAFDGWTLNSNGTGTIYRSSYTPTGDTTLYARWIWRITYNVNGGSGTPPTSYSLNPTDPAVYYPTSYDISIPSGSGLSRTGYRFNGWNTNAAGTGTNYAAGNTYRINGNATLYARWVAITDMGNNSWTSGRIGTVENDEQWFRFTATDTRMYIHFSLSSPVGLYMQLYNSGFGTVDSSSLMTYNSSTKYTTRSNLTVGQTYYIRITEQANYGGNYRIAVSKDAASP